MMAAHDERSAERIKALLAKIRNSPTQFNPQNKEITNGNASRHEDATSPDYTAELLTTSSNMDIFKSTQSRHITIPNDTLTLDKGNSVQSEDNAQQQAILLHPGSKQATRPLITLNAKQQAFSDLAFTGVDCVLIGAAGTGKTTSQRETLQRMIDTPGRIEKMKYGTRCLQMGRPGIVVVSFTRKACNNIRRVVPDVLKPNVVTIHSLLEFAPVFYEIEDKATGLMKNTMRFEPRRNDANPLPDDIQCIVFEESSMIGTDLYNMLHQAIQHEVQEIFLGDIQQLPPVFGQAVLGFKMSYLPVIELTEVYRQALQSPIIDTLWKILEGNPHAFASTIEHYDPKTGQPVKVNKDARIRVPALDGLSRETEFGILKFQVWQKNFNVDVALHTAVAQFKVWEQTGYYNPQEDIILCPFNKGFGTIELNKGISNYLSVKRNALVYEVIAGFNKHYLAAGDRVLYDKEDAFIEEILHNPSYLGKKPMPPSVELDRYGVYQRALTEEEALQAQLEQEQAELAKAEHFFDDVSLEEVEDRVHASSHEIRIRIAYTDEIITLRTAGDVNSLLGGYAITVHKFQGSEADNVFCVFHNSHAIMLERELIYTALSRGKKRVHVICENNTFEKAIKRQAIKGNTLAEKAVFFEGKQTKGSDYIVPVKNEGMYEHDIKHWQDYLAKSKSIDQQEGGEEKGVDDQGLEDTTSGNGMGVGTTERGDVLDGAEYRESQGTPEQDQITETPAERATRILKELREKKGSKR